MDLREFLDSPYRNLWINDSGLDYYVYKCLIRKGLIVLSNCNSDGTTVGGMWRFLRKYSAEIPFQMQQVINPQLAQYMRRLEWHEQDVGGCPQFWSPLAYEMFKDTIRDQPRTIFVLETND